MRRSRQALSLPEATGQGAFPAWRGRRFRSWWPSARALVLPTSPPGTGNAATPAGPGRAATAARVLARARRGFWLLAIYYLADLAAMASVGWTARAAAAPLTLACLLLGITMLSGVTICNRRAREPLQQQWPELARVTPPARPRRARRRKDMQPQNGAAGPFYVAGLIILAAMAGVSVTLAGAAAASATNAGDDRELQQRGPRPGGAMQRAVGS